MKKKAQTPAKLGNREIKINFGESEFIPSVYGPHVLLQIGPDEVTVSFYEAVVRPMLSPTEADFARLQKVGIRAECVARVVIPKGKFPGIAKVFMQIADEMTEARKDAEDAVNQ